MYRITKGELQFLRDFFYDLSESWDQPSETSEALEIVEALLEKGEEIDE